MSLENLISAVVGAFAVWLFSEVSKKRQADRDRRALIGRALSCLLSLYHRVRVIEDYTEHLTQQLSLPESGRRAYRASLEYVLPQEDKFVSRYEEAIDQLSEIDPVTAFELRDRAKISRLLSGIPSMTTFQSISVEEKLLVEGQLKEVLIPALEKAVKELARLYGGVTLRRVNDILNSQLKIPSDLDNFLQKAEPSPR